jgi:Ca2+-binding RTX toxin-like protein
VSATDVQGGSLTGTATIGADGRATITVGLLADNLTEGTETLSVTAAGKTALKIINDTSTSVSPYTLVPASNIENEGYELSFTLTNMNVAIGSSYSYTLSGISSSDIQGGSLTGTATIGSDGQATIIVTVLADGLTEGTETLTVSVAGQTASTIIRDTNLFISGAGGNDALDGSELDDVLLGRNGNDTLNGGAGHDILRGGSGNDLLMGGAGDDKLWGESEADRLFGGDGNDILIGGRSTDYYDGGSGSDTIDDTSFRFSGSVSIDLALGLRNGNDGIIESFVSIENYIGSENNDSIRGDNLDNRLSGNSGDDVIFGGDGNDIISGDDGNDVLDGGDGSDTAIFSRALDQYSLTEAGDTIIVSDNILRAGYSDTLTNFELLRFSDQTIIVQDFLALLRAGVFHRGARGSID